MPYYRISGLDVTYEPKFDRLKTYSDKYINHGTVRVENAIDLNLSYDFIEERQKENPHLSLADCEYIWTGAYFASKLLEHNGFVLHSSAISYEGKAYLFSAESGTGKSTHTSYWQEVFGKDKTVIINDDKPAIRQMGNTFYASGTPFSGKSPASTNIDVPIKAICFIYRSEKNEIRQLDSGEALKLLFEQTLRPKAKQNALNLLETLDKFLKDVPVYSLGVTHSKDSALFAFNSLNT